MKPEDIKLQDLYEYFLDINATSKSKDGIFFDKEEVKEFREAWTSVQKIAKKEYNDENAEQLNYAYFIKKHMKRILLEHPEWDLRMIFLILYMGGTAVGRDEWARKTKPRTTLPDVKEDLVNSTLSKLKEYVENKDDEALKQVFEKLDRNLELLTKIGAPLEAAAQVFDEVGVPPPPIIFAKLKQRKGLDPLSE